MSSSWTTLLLLHLFIFHTFCYKLPISGKEHLVALNDEILDNQKQSFLGKAELLRNPEWDTAKNLEELLSSLVRSKRDALEIDSSLPAPNTLNATSEELTSDAQESQTPIIIETSSSHSSPASMNLMSESDTTAVYESKPQFSSTTEDNQHISEVHTTPLSQTNQTDSLRSPTETSTLVPDLLLTLGDSASSEASDGTTAIFEEITTFDKVLSTTLHYTESKESGKGMVDNKTFNSASTTSSESLLEDNATSQNSSNTYDGTTKRMTDSTSSFKMTTMAESAEQGPPVHSIMKQCMLIILILAVVCTVFIICTIALAAKLSTLKSRYKQKQAASYAEMMCISTLPPENSQNNNVHLKKMKTFTTNGEDSDGDDDTTLNSFLPEH
ncbi:P-selectin glyco ligand 1 [Pelobates cultripes]|uniref:P-selectin glyco ligand 1 n=1 Tax=Pelobates cultripes TaxID=61616 RepID=A0AAD1S9L3_PELCU|nr:P-selectin glyco ligand 1 [Pelobates cultripes]